MGQNLIPPLQFILNMTGRYISKLFYSVLNIRIVPHPIKRL